MLARYTRATRSARRLVLVLLVLVGCAAPAANVVAPTATTSVVAPVPPPTNLATEIPTATAANSSVPLVVTSTPRTAAAATSSDPVAPANVAPTAPAAAPARPTVAASAPAAPTDDWPTYHRDNARTGLDPTLPSFTEVSEAWRSAGLDGDVYAEPLVVGGRVLVATANDTVYSLDGRTGRTIWQAHLGEPIARSQLPCGNIDTTGIISTPVVDAGRGLLYAVPFVQPGRHELVALDLATGAVRFRQPIDPPGIEVLSHQQRAALALSQNQVYVAFGGLFGDCGNYHGWLVAASADDGSVRSRYQVPTHREGAIWAPSGPSIDAAGNVYAATGNGSSVSASDFDFGDSVLRLSPRLQLQDWFAPANWVDLNRADADIGSLGPALLDNGLIFQIGKSGVGYLLHADHLGHENGQAFSATVCSSAFGGTAYAARSLYVPCGNGLVALSVQDTPAFALRWRQTATFAGPPIIAGGAVWTIARDGTLYALDPDDGHVRYRAVVGTPTHFATPSASGGFVFVPAARRILALSLQ